MSEHIRTSFGEADDVRDEGLTTPDDVVRYDDILYGADQKWQTLDIYRPQKAEAGCMETKSVTSTIAWAWHSGGLLL